MYKFENLSGLVGGVKFDEKTIEMMDKIMKSTKNKGNILKAKIFNFIIRAIDIYKTDRDQFLKDLKSILAQIEFDFKDSIKEKVGSTQEVKNFLKIKLLIL